MRTILVIVFAVLLVILGNPSLTSASPFPKDRGCDKVGVFCFDVDEGNKYSNGTSTNTITIRFSITIKRNEPFDVSRPSHHWLFWLGDQLENNRVTVAFAPNVTRVEHPGKVMDNAAHVSINMNIDKATSVAYGIFKSKSLLQPMPEEEVKQLFGDPIADHNSLTANSSPALAQMLRIEQDPMLVIVGIGFNTQETTYITSPGPIMMFKGPWTPHAETGTNTKTPGQENDEPIEISPSPRSGGNKWIWLAIGITMIFALILLIILLLYGIRFARFKSNTTSQRTKSTGSTGSFVSIRTTVNN